jgi:aarF domain-containing kinase
MITRRLLTDPDPSLRSSLEDLVLSEGALRWGRIENLLREGSKSIAFDGSKLWLLLDW